MGLEFLATSWQGGSLYHLSARAAAGAITRFQRGHMRWRARRWTVVVGVVYLTRNRQRREYNGEVSIGRIVVGTKRDGHMDHVVVAWGVCRVVASVPVITKLGWTGLGRLGRRETTDLLEEGPARGYSISP